MKLSISSWSFHRELPNTRGIKATEAIDLAGFVRLCRRRYNVEGVELWSGHILRPDDAAYVADLAATIAEADLEVVNLACDAAKVGLADRAARRENLQTLRRWIATAASLSCRAIRVNTAAGPDPEAALAAVVADYRALLPAVRRRGLALLMENHGGLSSDPKMLVRILDGVGDERFRACPDNGNFPPEAREEGLRAMAPRMALAHLKTLAFDPSGNETTCDIPAIVRLYRASGFDGYLSIEFEGKGDQYEGVERSVALARRAIREGRRA